MSNITFVKGCATIEWITFSDGTETCTIKHGTKDKWTIPLEFDGLNHIQIHIEDGTRDLIRLGLVKDALERLGVKDVKLTLGYFPQARADRVFQKGQPLPSKVFADILNSFDFSKVFIYDPHSDVTSALINNVEIITQSELLRNKLTDISRNLPDFKLCAPDLGSTKKIFDSVMMLGHEDYIQAVKIRDVKTGNIIKCDLTEDRVEGNILIIDDICDGAASFKFLAEKLKQKGANKVGLYITHGIFSKGLDVLKGYIDYVCVNNLVGNYITQEDIRRFNED
ncbi:putative ribose-phosphate pyrophosphokinase [Vibrio phage VPMCC14]|nr:putative ribose-phosphate pyrophosphokinase [Vibrio phage VPMCC14]